MVGTRRNQLLSHILLVLSIFTAPAVIAVPAYAQASDLAKLATYRGADRSERLLQGAKKEGELNLYISMANADNRPLVAAFRKKYGIKVNVWRASSDVILQRAISENNADKPGADVVAIDATGLEPLHNEHMLQRVWSPGISHLMAKAVPAHREWLPSYLNGFVQAYNTNAIKKDQLPHSWADLLKPEWKGKLGIEAKDSDWFAQVVLSLGEQKGLELFRDIVAKNGISARRGHTLLTNLVASGEVPLGLTPYDYSVTQMRDKGAPIDWFLIPPAIARASGVGVLKTAKHPNAAILFVDFCIGDGQGVLAKRRFTTVTDKFHPPFLSGPVTIIDPAVMLRRQQKWTALFTKTILEQPR